MIFHGKKMHNKFLKLYEIDSSKPMKNFDKFYDLAAYRTLVTVCDFFPDKKQNLILSLLKFDYDDLIKWANDFGWIILRQKISYFHLKSG